MDLDDFIITTFCMIDDTMKQLFEDTRLRQRGPAPALSDSETLTTEIVGEYLSLNQDKAIYDYFRRHYSHFFPAMAKIHRTTLTLWQRRCSASLRTAKCPCCTRSFWTSPMTCSALTALEWRCTGLPT